MVQISPFLYYISALAQATSPETSSNELVPRQSTPDIPPGALPSQCQSPCAVINTMANCDENKTCVCASSIGSGMVSCLNCLVALDPSSQAQAQADVNAWNEVCGGSLSLSGSSSSSAGKTGGVVGLKAAGLGICVVAAAIGSYFVL